MGIFLVWLLALLVAGSINKFLAHKKRIAEASRSGSCLKIAPGPFQWPVIGCLPAVGFKHRHRTFYDLSKRYGPVMFVPIGSTNLYVVHGTALAEELLRARDGQFCSRPLCMTGTYLGFDHQDLNLSPYNSNWKLARKAFSAELLSPSRLNTQISLRREEVGRMIWNIFTKAKQGCTINMTQTADELVTNIIVKMLFGKRYFDHNTGVDNEITSALCHFRETDLREGIFLWGELNLADFFPALARWDLQGLEARFKRLRAQLEWLFLQIIEDHKMHPRLACDQNQDDYITALLAQKQLSTNQLMGIMSNALIAGIDTTARAIEWAMAELVSNPWVIAKAQKELDGVLAGRALVEETDVLLGGYMEAVGKEVLRLHPSAPLDDPHFNEGRASSLGGFYIPPNSIVLLNLWALGQDPSLWDKPTLFDPDRFLLAPGGQSPQNNTFGHLPFSFGRRRCPAYQFATTLLNHAVGALLHAFDWTPKNGKKPDLQEGDGIVVGLKDPLLVSAIPRMADCLYEQIM